MPNPTPGGAVKEQVALRAREYQFTDSAEAATAWEPVTTFPGSSAQGGLRSGVADRHSSPFSEPAPRPLGIGDIKSGVIAEAADDSGRRVRRQESRPWPAAQKSERPVFP